MNPAIKTIFDRILVSTFYILISILIITCDSKKKDDFITYEFNIDSILTNDIIKFSDLFSDFEIIPLETRKENFYGASGAIIKLSNDHIYLLDRTNYKSLDIYTIKGDFVNRIQNIGRGPGEYNNPDDFDIDPKTGNVFIYDETSNQVLLYDFINSNLIESFKAPDPGHFQSFIQQDNSFYFFKGWGNLDKPDDAMLYKATAKGDILDKKLFFSDENITSIGSTVINNLQGNLFHSDRDIKVYWAWGNTIYTYYDEEVKPFLRYIGKIPTTADNNTGILRERGIQAYSDNGELALIKHESSFSMIINLEDGSFICARSFTDDMIQLKYLDIRFIWKNYIVAVYNPTIALTMERVYSKDKETDPKSGYPLIDILKSGDLKMDAPTCNNLIERIKQNLSNGGGTTNPVIVLFKIKDDLLTK